MTVHLFRCCSLAFFLVLLLTHLTLPAMSAPKRSASLPIAKGIHILQPFDYRNVTIDDGPLRRQFDEVRDYYLHIPNDDLLKGFRQRAGLPAPGLDLGGWYGGDTFHVFGQIIGGLSRMYAATGDTRCREKANALVMEWGRCIAPDGYFFASSAPNAPHYIYEKMVGGLVDNYLYCGNSEALTFLRHITKWAEKNLERVQGYQGATGGIEWYTLSENLYRAYLATGDSVYRELAQAWEYPEHWNLYAEKKDIFGPRKNGERAWGYHAYSHVNSLSGAAAAYLVKGEIQYLDVIRNAYDSLQQTQCFSTGGYGPDELLLPHDSLLKVLQESHKTFETQCGSWAAFKLSKYLTSFTGDARYGDWVERLTVNGIGASIPMAPDGKVFYYSDYNPGGARKQQIDIQWSCCTGTRSEAIADYFDLIYYHDARDLYVSLFTPSTVRWKVGNTTISVQQRTRFPEEEETSFIIHTPKPVSFGLHVRVPGWLALPMQAKVNGKTVAVKANNRHWATIDRTWRDGDTLEVKLPMAFWVSHFNSSTPYPASILRGPVVLAVRSPYSNPATKIDLAHLDRDLVNSPGEPLTYHLAGDSTVLFRPFAAFKEGEPYFLYLDPARKSEVQMPRIISHRELIFSDGWNVSAQFRFSNVVDASVEGSFEGTGVKWLGSRFDDAGKAEVAIDGKPVAVVDQYGPGRGLPFEWKIEALSPGKHTIRLTILKDADPASKDHFINVAGFEVVE